MSAMADRKRKPAAATKTRRTKTERSKAGARKARWLPASGESKHPRPAPLPTPLAAAVDRLRAICLALPEASEKISWGESTWRAGKIFAQMDTFHHGAEHVAVWLPARPGVQADLVEENPEQFFVPPYVGHKGWIGVRIDRKPDWKVVAGLVADAYREVAPPHLVERLDADRRATRGWQAGWLRGGADEVES
jgi:hypothetical protein